VNNPYLPYPVRIDSVTTETEDRNLKTFKFLFLNPRTKGSSTTLPGPVRRTFGGGARGRSPSA